MLSVYSVESAKSIIVDLLLLASKHLDSARKEVEAIVQFEGPEDSKILYTRENFSDLVQRILVPSKSYDKALEDKAADDPDPDDK